MMQYNFIPQKVRGNPKVIGQGILDVSNKDAIFSSGQRGSKDSRVLGILKNPEIIFINSEGIMLKGYEPAGIDKAGRTKFNYQEWYCQFIEETKG